MEKCEGYFDSNGKQYYVGDLVLNLCFGDIWLVDKYTQEEISNYKPDCPYCLKLYTSADQDIIDLDEPVGFVIRCHKGDKDYQDVYDECIKILKELKKEEKE